MRPLSILFLASAGLALLSPGALARSNDIKVEAPLLRPASPPDADAKGRVRAEHDPDDDRDKLDFELEHLDLALTYELYMDDGLGALTLIGTFVIDDEPNQLELDFDTEEDLPLPFGATQVAALAGRAVEVRSSGAVYLFGTVPDINGGTGGGSGGGGGGGGSGSDWVTSKSFLSRPIPAPDSNATGYVELRKRAKDNRERFKVEADHIDTSIAFAVFLENALGSGVLENVGSMSVDGVDEVELELDTGDGAQLPFGVAVVDDLIGRRVEVRDDLGAVYLFGTVPSIGTSQKADQAKSSLAGDDGKGQIRIAIQPKKGNQSFEVQVKKTLKKTLVDLYLFNSVTSQFELVASIKTNGGGNGSFEVKTKKGHSLPLGATDVADLSGAAVEVRVPGTGAVLLTGTVPTL